tara:strand:+ start:1153 stop:1809 length:657 start_codon:yes stop_codon:yes gene_type:complete
MNITALLPMKKNSERVPNKNFKILAHKPLYKWILDSLLSIKEIEKIVINTDAISKLSELLKNEKITLRERNPNICGDFVSMNKVIEDDLKNIDSDIFIMTHTTNPFLSPQTIKHCVDKFIKEDCDSLFSVNKVQSRFYNSKALPINHDPKDLIRTQDLEPFFEENSCIYIFTKESFFKNLNRIGENPIFFETSKIESIDIDNKEDWDLAEIIAKKYYA